MPLIPLTHRSRSILSLITTVSTALTLLRSHALRTALKSLFSPSQHPYRLTALVTALLLNSKALPLMWHFRFFTTMIYQLRMQPTALPKDALFRPIILKGCYTSLMECDYNLHKSNSTYFADLDIGRTALISALLRQGILEARGGKSARARAVAQYKERMQSNTQAGEGTGGTQSQMPTLDSVVDTNQQFLIALGGVATQFKRELKPYETFDIWTRVLAWDRKWVYVVQHMVKPGAISAEDMQAESCWGLQPWKEVPGSNEGFLARLFGGNPKARKPSAKSAGAANGAAPETQDSFEAKRAAWQKSIFATSISKYVIKKGRLTIPAEEVLIHNDLVPLRPVGDAESETGDAGSGSEWSWNWTNIERERQRGLKLAAQFGALDGLVEEFPGAPEAPFIGDHTHPDRVRVLGAYPDAVW